MSSVGPYRMLGTPSGGASRRINEVRGRVPLIHSRVT